MAIYPYRDIWPRIDATAYIHPDAVIIGDVEIGAETSIWPGVVIRGDVNFIRIGQGSNVQDGSVLHVGRPLPGKPDGAPLWIGDHVTIGHKVALHGCRLLDWCMVGIGAIVLDHAIVAEDAMVGAGSLVAPGKQVGRGELWMGSPARMKRLLTEEEQQAIRATTENYCQLARHYTDTRLPA
jgi:carbonic anhydrase/acetyltransferase-like protein (isoleucine patch superfamily)